MLPLVALAAAAPFDAARVHSEGWAPATAGVDLAPAFADAVLAGLGEVAVVALPAADAPPESRAWRVRFEGERVVLGVTCVAEAYVVDLAPGYGQWGCRVGPASAEAFGVPVGTKVELGLPAGNVVSVHLYGGATLALGPYVCAGEVGFYGGAAVGTPHSCTLAHAQRLSGVDLPAGAAIHVTEDGRLRSATIRGSTVRAAGRTWGPDYTPCGALFLWFEDDGTLRPPEADPLRETCCD